MVQFAMELVQFCLKILPKVRGKCWYKEQHLLGLCQPPDFLGSNLHVSSVKAERIIFPTSVLPRYVNIPFLLPCTVYPWDEVRGWELPLSVGQREVCTVCGACVIIHQPKKSPVVVPSPP